MILGAQAWTRRRFDTAAIGADGRRAAATYSDSSILLSAQAANGKDSELLPEGFRTSEHLKLYSETSMATESQRAQTKADELIAPTGEVYRVMASLRFHAIIPHYKAIAVRVQE